MFTRPLMWLRSHCSRAITPNLFQYVTLPHLLSKLPRSLAYVHVKLRLSVPLMVHGAMCPSFPVGISDMYLLYMIYSTKLCLKKITLYMF